MSANAETYPTPAEGWTCFHCGMHFGGNFKGWQEALHHFGENVRGDAWCQYTARQVRAMESMLSSYQQEDTPRDRHLAKLESEHAVALRQEEEKGYARGLRDASYTEIKDAFEAMRDGKENARSSLYRVLAAAFPANPQVTYSTQGE